MRLEISVIRAMRYKEQMFRVLECQCDTKTSTKANTMAGTMKETRFKLRSFVAAIYWKVLKVVDKTS